MGWRRLLLLLGFWLAMAARAAGLAPTVAEHAVLGAGLDQPTAVAADGSGKVYVLDARSRAAVFGPDGRTLASLDQAGLTRPLDLALTDDGLLVADTWNHCLVLLRRDGGVEKTYALPVDSKTGPPEPVAVAVLDGLAYWADRRSHRICRLRLDSGAQLDCFGGRGEKPGEFLHPFQIAVDRDDYLHVVDIANARVQSFDRTGRHFGQVGRFGLSPGELYRPNGLAIDRDTDTLFVSDGYFGTIAVFRKGEPLGVLTGTDGKPVVLDSPTGLAFRDGKLYVAETGGSRLHRYSVAFREGAAPPPREGQRAELSQKNCVLCHLTWAHEAPTEARAPDVQGALPDASFRMCYSCHNGPVMDSRTTIHRGAQHPSLYESAEAKRRHAQAGPRKDKLPKDFHTESGQPLACTACHTPHTDADKAETLYGTHGNAWLRVPNKGGDLCERCHESKGKGTRETDPHKRGLNHPLAIKFAPPPFEAAPGYPSNPELHKGLPLHLSAAGAALGKDRTLICQTCHQVHGGHDEGELTVLGRNQGKLCAACHQRQFSEGEKAAHAEGVHPINIERKPGVAGAKPVLWKGRPEITEVGCETCHKVHAGAPGTALLPRDADSAATLCRNCHERQHSGSAEQAHVKGVHQVGNRRKSDVPGETPVLWKGSPEITEVTCDTCHKVHSGSPNTALLPEGADSAKTLCRNCHERQHSGSPEEAHRKGIHPVNVTRKAEKPGEKPVLWEGRPEITEVTCATCHKVHSGTGETALLPEGIRTAEALCQNCHPRQHADGKDEARRKGVHPVGATLDEPVEIAGKKVKKIGCLSCHAVHNGQPDTAALVEPDRGGQLCEHCHERKTPIVGTDHDLRITAKDAKNAHGDLPADSGACGACHTLHRGQGELPFLFSAKRVPDPSGNPADRMDETPFKRDALCLNCHQRGGIAEAKIVKHFSHPHRDLVLRSDPKLLPLLGPDEQAAEFGGIACITCHEPHAWEADRKPAVTEAKAALSDRRENLEGSQRDSFLRHKGVGGTFCVDCHGPEALVKYKFFHDADRARNRGLEYLR